MKNKKLLNTLSTMGLMTALICQPFAAFGAEGESPLYMINSPPEGAAQRLTASAEHDTANAENENPKNIVKLEYDTNGDIIGKEELNVNPLSIDYSTFEDGLYVIYRGTSWVFGNDASLEMTFDVTPNTPQVFSKTITNSTAVKKASTTGVTFDAKYVKLAITQAYDKTISDTVSKQATINMTVPEGKVGFFKIYSTYTRYDVVRVANRAVTHSAATYEFSGVKAISQIVDAGNSGSIDTNGMVIREDKCLLQEVDDSFWQIIDTTPNLDILTTGRDGSKIFDLNNQMIFNMFNYTSPSCRKLNFIFNVREPGTYVFYLGKTVNADLCTLNVNAKDQINRIEYKKADGFSDTTFSKYLEAGNYVLSLSNLEDANKGGYGLMIIKQ